MLYVNLAKRPLALVVFVAAIAVVLLSSGANNASAGGFSFTGVTCMDVSLGGNINTKIITRIEPGAGGFDVTSVAYDGDINGDTIPDGPPTIDSCVDKVEPGSMTAGIEFQEIDIHARPSALATLLGAETQCNDAADDDGDGFVNDGCPRVGGFDDDAVDPAECANNTDAPDEDPAGGVQDDDVVVNDGCPTVESLNWEVDCQFNSGISQWVLTKFNIIVTGKTTLSTNTGTLNAWLDPTACPEDPLGAPTVSLAVVSVIRDSTGAGTSDWDGDGRSDWDELAAVGSGTGPDGCDPFNPADDLCGPVGGIAELPDAATAPLGTASSSSNKTGLIAAVAAVAAMTAVALGGSAWYVQRRRLR